MMWREQKVLAEKLVSQDGFVGEGEPLDIANNTAL